MSIWILLPSTPVLAQDEVTYAEVNPNRDCGLYAAGVAIAISQNRRLTFEEVKSSIHADENGQTSLLEVARYLEAHGLRVRSAPAEDDPPDRTSIAALKGTTKEDVNHFVVIRPAPNGRFIVYSPPYWARVEEWNAIRPMVVGKMLTYGEPGPTPMWRVIVAGLGLGLLVGGLIRRLRPGYLGMAAIIATGLSLVACEANAETACLEILGGNRQDVGTTDLTGGFMIAVRNRTSRDLTVRRTATSCGCGFVGLEEGFVFKAGCISRFNVAISLKADESRSVDFSVDLKEVAQPLRFTLVARGPKASGIHWRKEQDLESIRVGRPKTVQLRVTLGPEFEVLAGPQRVVPAVRWVVSDPSSIRVLSRRPESTATWTPGTVLSAQLELRCTYPGRRRARVEAICGNLVVPFHLKWDCVGGLEFDPGVILLRSTESGLIGETRCMWKDGGDRIQSLRSSDSSVVATLVRDGEAGVLKTTATPSWGDRVTPQAEVSVRYLAESGQIEESVVKVVFVR